MCSCRDFFAVRTVPLSGLVNGTSASPLVPLVLLYNKSNIQYDNATKLVRTINKISVMPSISNICDLYEQVHVEL